MAANTDGKIRGCWGFYGRLLLWIAFFSFALAAPNDSSGITIIGAVGCLIGLLLMRRQKQA